MKESPNYQEDITSWEREDEAYFMELESIESLEDQVAYELLAEGK